MPQSRHFKNEWKRNHFRLKSMFDDKLDFFGKKKKKKKKKIVSNNKRIYVTITLILDFSQKYRLPPFLRTTFLRVTASDRIL